jgi:hypothetical protein
VNLAVDSPDYRSESLRNAPILEDYLWDSGWIASISTERKAAELSRHLIDRVQAIAGALAETPNHK